MDRLVNRRGEKKYDNPQMKRGKFKKERLREAMLLRGMDKPSQLAKFLGVKPQVAYKWWAGQTPNMRAADLFWIADKFEVSNRWLLGLSDSRTKAEPLDPEQQRVLAVYKALRALPDKQWAEDWVQDGYKLLEKLGAKPSTTAPYPNKSKIPN